MNTDAPRGPPAPFVTTKLVGGEPGGDGGRSAAPLKTIPVGEPGSAPGPGIATTSGTIWPAPLYSVETPPPLSAPHTGPQALNPMPHALTRLASGPLGLSAVPVPSDTR